MSGKQGLKAGGRRRSITPPPPDPDPDPTPQPPVGDFVTGFTAAQVQALPSSGPEFEYVRSQAASGLTNFLYQDGNPDDSGRAFCAGLMYLFGGETAYRNKIIAACERIMAYSGTYHHAFINRKFGGLALAAHLVGYNDTAWKNFSTGLVLRTSNVTGPSKAIPTASCAWQWDNNHGGAATGTYVAVCAVNGIKTATHNGHPGGYENAKKWLYGWLGDHSSTGFPHVDSNNTTYAQGMGVTLDEGGESRGWQDNPSQPYGIVPATASDVRKRGAVPADAFRGAGAFPEAGTDSKHYVYGNAGRRMNGAIILSALGYRDVWQVNGQALKRWRQWMNDYGKGNPEGPTNQIYDVVINKVYGTSWPARDYNGGNGEVIDGTSWLVKIPSWPVR